MTKQMPPAQQANDETNDSRVDQIKDKVREIAGMAEDRAHSIKERAVEVKSEAMTRGRAFLDRAEDFIRANPIKAVGIAFGAGYFGMGLLRR